MSTVAALIPISYQGFQTSEAIFDPAWANDPLKRFRMTRKGWGEFFGAKYPQKYIDKLKERNPELPQGIAVTVTGMTGQEYRPFTLDIWEGYQYAIQSTLPKAKEFLRRFPAFIKAIMKNALIPDKVLSVVARQVPRSLGRRQAIMKISQDTGECSTTIYRRIRRIIDGKPVYESCPTMKKGYIHKRHRDVCFEAMQLITEGSKVKEVADITGVPVQTLYRWRKRTA